MRPEIDIRSTIIAKSDQINAADLAAPITVEITDAQYKRGDDQPLALSLSGPWQPWKPCKGMRRLLVQAWGPNAAAYVGRRVKLYNDPDVKWGGAEVGGIRVSAMSHVSTPFDYRMVVARGRHSTYRIEVLSVDAHPNQALFDQLDAAKVAAAAAGVPVDELRGAAHRAGLKGRKEDAPAAVLERLVEELQTLAKDFAGGVEGTS